jgi:nucleoside-diphosphate-sugar epimerase
LDEKTQKEVLRNCEAIVHVCYYSDLTDINHYFEVNTIASWRLLKSALECGVRYFFYLSTYLLYNPELSGDASFVETDAVFSKDFYTANKLAIEGYCRGFSMCSALKCVVLRLGAVYGICRRWEALSHSPYSVQMKLAIENKDIEVFGQSPLIWVGDVAGTIVAILDNPEKASELYNVVDFNLRWEDCAKRIVEITGSHSKIVSVAPAHKPIVVNGERLKRDFNLKFVGLKGFDDFLRMLRDKILCQQL